MLSRRHEWLNYRLILSLSSMLLAARWSGFPEAFDLWLIISQGTFGPAGAMLKAGAKVARGAHSRHWLESCFPLGRRGLSSRLG